MSETLIARAARGLIFLYRVTFSAFAGRGCRYAPTCSEYTDEAIQQHGLWAGGWMGLARICRCGPFGTHGIDLVPDVPNWREYENKVQMRGAAKGGSRLTLVESVRQDRRRQLTGGERHVAHLQPQPEEAAECRHHAQHLLAGATGFSPRRHFAADRFQVRTLARHTCTSGGRLSVHRI